MGVEVRRGPSLLATTVPILIMLLHAHICRAVSPVRGNSSTSGPYNGDQEECLVGDIAPEEEFLMGSETNRRLLAPNSVTYNILNSEKLVGKSVACRPGYRACLPRGNNPPKPIQKCGPYTRDCHH